MSRIEQHSHILFLPGILRPHIRGLLLWFHRAEFVWAQIAPWLQSHVAGLGVTD